MDGILYWLAVGAAGLFFLAVVVAWWEHLGRIANSPGAFASTPPRALTVDLNLDKATEGSDAATRREVLEGALERMTQPGALSGEHRRGWTDTTPMVGPGALTPQTASNPAPAPAPSRQG